MKQCFAFAAVILCMSLTLMSCGANKHDETAEKEQTAMKMNVQVGAYTFTATLKVGPLGRSLTAIFTVAE